MERAFAKMKTKAKWAGAFFVVSLGWLHVAFTPADRRIKYSHHAH